MKTALYFSHFSALFHILPSALFIFSFLTKNGMSPKVLSLTPYLPPPALLDNGHLQLWLQQGVHVATARAGSRYLPTPGQAPPPRRSPTSHNQIQHVSLKRSHLGHIPSPSCHSA